MRRCSPEKGQGNPREKPEISTRTVGDVRAMRTGRAFLCYLTQNYLIMAHPSEELCIRVIPANPNYGRRRFQLLLQQGSLDLLLRKLTELNVHKDFNMLSSMETFEGDDFEIIFARDEGELERITSVEEHASSGEEDEHDDDL